MDADFTTIRISVGTRDRLIAIGKKGDTYEEIIQKLLDLYESYEKERENEVRL